MSNPTPTPHAMTDEELKRMIAEADTGGRRPIGWAAGVLSFAALAWSLFQLWFASPLPFSFGFFILNDTEARALHLALAVFLGYLAYPAFKRSPRAYIPVIDWVLAAAGAFCAAYLYLFYRELSTRPGLPTQMDLIVAIAGITLLLEVTRRVLGLPMVILAIVFIGYIFLGPYMPEMIAHRGASLNKGMSHLWLSTEGVFGVALGVSTSFIFLFVLFGALLETAGAGNYFIKAAISMLGHMHGGPAKASVVASATTGLISGSSIANVVTTGTFTIPLMKRVGYKPTKAAAIEVAASVDGQIMPPVMGAAAFLMVEYVGITYNEVIKHAFLPAIISYTALFYLVHLEAMKANIRGLPRRNIAPASKRLISFGLTVSGLIILAGLVYYGLGWIKDLTGEASTLVVSVLMLIAYVALVRYSAQQPELHMDDPNKPLTELPETGPTLKTGLYFLLPVVALIWNLMVEELSPGLSAFWATVFMIFILVTQRPLQAFFRGQGNLPAATMRGLGDLYHGLVNGARNMIGIGIATAAAGIIVGTVTLTGVGLVLTEFVELVSGGNLMIMLFMVAFICLILGLGLPTTANYIIVSTLMAPVVVEVGAQNGLLVPLIAVHMFVFYFGLMADATPPVGLAAYAAAGIARCDPIVAGAQAFLYSIRTAILPFMFIFNTQLLMIGIDSWWIFVLTVSSAILANLMFAAATQGWFFTRNRAWEGVALLLITFSLFRPGFWMDMLYPPYEQVPVSELTRVVEQAPDNASLRVFIEGISIEGKDISKGVLLPLGPQGSLQERLNHAGVMVSSFGGQVSVVSVRFGSQAAKLGVEQGLDIAYIELPTDRPRDEWMFIPPLLLLGLIAWLQLRRRALHPVHQPMAT
ncbi:TRAP transporter fused permease subunit [Pseudothauera nasutitermitis]|uniref:TRAP transporter fused permease subunit n=1 Tax=Pseudothauera nasutitermitis TaxID=2565930 RepID=A0A4S4B3H9_9RHOO|nr:TRAP transporter permease [Pseudothauera nasutitermitis]THF67169.1 TRAP transporter fused permease subunit [Pseudothauera nasutitermitis]